MEPDSNDIMETKGRTDYLVKILIIGDSGVGKTCLLLRFADNSFTTSHLTTIGIDLKVRTLNIDGKTLKLQAWDTAGQERFRTLTQTYYHGAAAVILAYDCTDRLTFSSVQHWSRQIQTHSSPSILKVLVATKCDRPCREVTAEEGQTLAENLGMSFFETSARSGENVEEVFRCVARSVKNCRDEEIREMTGEKLKPLEGKRRKRVCWFF
jgi:Ras-related protein Rab-8A